MSKKRAAFYVDGFNLYHSIKSLKNDRIKWLSLKILANLLIPKRDECVTKITYFSALAQQRGFASLKRHEAYIAALESEGVQCILGRFKQQIRGCKNCGASWKQHEEKETDVNIAIQMVADAYDDEFDICYLISADTDLVPPLELIKAKHPAKEIVAVSPPNRPHGQHIRSVAHRSLKLNSNQLAKCRLPNQFIWKGRQYSCPPDYR